MAMAMAIRRPAVTLTFFLLAAAPSFLFAPAVHAATSSDLVEGVCRETRDYAFCIQALASDPKTPGAKDHLELARISLNLAISNATDARSYINGLYECPETDPKKKPALKICVSGYDAAVVSFRSALGELEQDPLTAKYDFKVAGDGAQSCEDRLGSGSGVNDSSVSTRNRITLSFSNIADVVTAHLIKLNH